MPKTIEIEVVSGCIHYGDAVHQPGAAFDCEPNEARRLINLGVARESLGRFQTVPLDTDLPEEARATLLAAIAAANSPEALTALMPDTEPDDEIKAAFEFRMSELEK